MKKVYDPIAEEFGDEYHYRDMTTEEIAERNRVLMFGENWEAFPSDEEWSMIVD
jgi:hypothetical protein